MGSIPSWLLRHSGSFRPLLGTAADGSESYGPAVEVPQCFVDEKPRLVRGNTNGGFGDARLAEMTVFLPLGLDPSLPLGSRFHHDQTGRSGIVLQVQVFDGNGLPTPDHLEVSVGEVS